jgi:hypothetical protein
VNAAGQRLHEVLGAHGLCAHTTFFRRRLSQSILELFLDDFGR